jgi:hypothetical protein
MLMNPDIHRVYIRTCIRPRGRIERPNLCWMQTSMPNRSRKETMSKNTLPITVSAIDHNPIILNGIAVLIGKST